MKLKQKISSIFTILKARALNKKIPLLVTFRPTYTCNFNCKYCNVSSLKEKEMSTKQILSMIDQLRCAGMQKFGLTGGEPLLRKDIGEIIDYCKSSGIFTTLSSNGSLIPKKINQLRNLDILQLSLDGPPKIHDKLRKKGSQKEVLKAIKIARKNKIKVVVLCVITGNGLNGAVEQIDYLLGIAKKMGFLVAFQPVFDTKFARKGAKKYLMRREVYEKIVKKIIERKEKGEPIAYSKSTYEYLLKLDKLPKEKRMKCYAGKLYFAITPSGNVFPCAGLIDKMNCLNGTKAGFVNAVRKIPKTSCNTCSYVCYIENNKLFNFKLGSLLNLNRNIKKLR